MFPEYDCSTCTARLKMERGCDGNARLPAQLGELEFKTCPRRPILDNPRWFADMYRTYSMYKEGYLPAKGTVNDQAVGFLQFISAMDAALSFCNSVET